MSKSASIFALLAVIIVGLSTACQRRSLKDADYNTAVIDVKIDWSESNIPITPDDPTGGEHVHRVSLRFFPHDGSPVFDRYLEGNIFEGTVEVPMGKYDVVVMNESVNDVYWRDAITFSDINDFDNMSATINPMATADITARFPFYTPEDGERVIIEPLRLASWSIRDFDVTSDLVIASRSTRGTRGTRSETRAETEAALNALTKIVMKRLTCNVNVTAHVTNLVSAQALYTAAKGFADKVYIASGTTAQSPSTYLFTLNGRVMDDNGLDGTTRRTFLSFGRSPQDGASEYTITMDIALVTGELHTGDGPLEFDVTDQVLSNIDLVDIDLDLTNEGGSIELPYVEGGIFVGDWGDEVIDLN